MILAQYKSNIQDFTALNLSDGYSSHPRQQMDVFMHISEIDFFNLHNYLPWDFLIHISAHPPSFILFSLQKAF